MIGKALYLALLTALGWGYEASLGPQGFSSPSDLYLPLLFGSLSKTGVGREPHHYLQLQWSMKPGVCLASPLNTLILPKT